MSNFSSFPTISHHYFSLILCNHVVEMPKHRYGLKFDVNLA